VARARKGAGGADRGRTGRALLGRPVALVAVDAPAVDAPMVDAPVVDPPADASSFMVTVKGRGRSQRFCSSSTHVSWSGRQ